MDTLLKVREHLPKFKVSLFAVPDDIKHRQGDRESALRLIKANLDWMQIVPHGLNHNSAEAMKWTYEQFRNEILPAIVDAFDKDKLPFVEGFCAPHWKWTDGVVRALDDLGWWGAVNPRIEMLSTKKVYRFTHSIEEELDEDIMSLYGHVDGTSKNDLERCFDNLIRLPRDGDWEFASDFVEDK
jgi:hypothetical protein